MTTKADKLKELILREHVHQPNTRCTAKVKPPEYPMGRPPGPVNPPIYCCLQAGHEGPHRCDHGGMVPSFPFRASYEVIFREAGPGHCSKCRTGWPCATVKEVEEILAGED